jgi:hypothetical protein
VGAAGGANCGIVRVSDADVVPVGELVKVVPLPMEVIVAS